MSRGARHNYGQPTQPFRKPPAGSCLAAITADVGHVLSAEADRTAPLGEVTAHIEAECFSRLNELFAERLPDYPASEREAWARSAAKGAAEKIRLAFGGEPPRRPGRPENDPFLCAQALAYWRHFQKKMPHASQDRLYSATAAALGPGITKRQARSAVQAAGAKIALWVRDDAEPCHLAEVAQAALFALWQVAGRRVATDTCPQQTV